MEYITRGNLCLHTPTVPSFYTRTGSGEVIQEKNFKNL
jgi:hypothetical protein